VATEFLQLQNSVATANLLEALGIDHAVRFSVIPAVLPVAVVSGIDVTRVDKLAWGTVVQPAGGANIESQCQLFNPVTSGVTIHADSVIVTASAATEVSIALFDTALTTLSTLTDFRDRRVDGSPVAQVRRQTNATPLGDDKIITTVAANEAIILPLDSYLRPGTGVIIVLKTSDLELKTGWYWEEIPA